MHCMEAKVRIAATALHWPIGQEHIIRYIQRVDTIVLRLYRYDCLLVTAVQMAVDDLGLNVA
jgi:hypothetical protein